MKVIVCFVLLSSVLCELPPPYPSQYFKTSSHILPSRYLPPHVQQTGQPQTVYGPPPSFAEPLDPSFVQPSNPSKLRSVGNFQRLPQLRDTLRAPNPSQNAFLQPVPQRIYGPPNINILSPQITSVPQPTYGPPKILNSLPQTTYAVPDNQISPQNRYNLAPFSQNILPQTNIGPSNQQQGPTRILNSLPQTTYGVPDKQINLQNQNSLSPFLQNPLPQTNYKTSNQQQEPSRNYGTPSVDAATLEEIRQLRLLILKIEAQRLVQQNSQYPLQQNTLRGNRPGQSLPNKEAGTFRLSLSEQYLPVKEPGNFKKDVSLTFDQEGARNVPQNSNKYIPPRREQPKNTWNNLDLPAGTSPNVDIRKVEVTQFGPNRNVNKNNNNNNNNGVRNDNDNNEGEVNNKYIPPSTTVSSAKDGSFSPTEPPLDSTTPESSYQLSEDTFAESPNIALATPSVQGLPDNQQLYLLHPDGRYQKIVSSKNRPQNNRQNHLLSSYQIYQNLQVDPNVIYGYAPVYSVLTK